MKMDLNVNGNARTVQANPAARLLDVLREELQLTGTKEGCGQGECGACTILIDGQPVNSCLMPVAQAIDHEIRTIEDLADGGELHAVQQALVQYGGLQCGICTPGIVLAALVAVYSEPDASRVRIRELLAGNLCRCTGYQMIVDAVQAAARQQSRVDSR
ncbi:MAG: (2Fe-2S)-binding protein [Planctomycetaceae bacterium]